jgi:hypothetical protein
LGNKPHVFNVGYKSLRSNRQPVFEFQEVRMNGSRKWIVLFMIAVFLLMPIGSGAFAGMKSYPPENSGPLMVADFLVARPLGLASLVLGSVSFVVTLPFSALGKNVGEAFEYMIVDPAVYTFARPLGGF